MTTYRNFSDAWFATLFRAIQHGDQVSPRGMKTRELRWDQLTVDDPMTFPVRVDGRNFADVIGVLEATSLVGQFSIPELFTDRIAKFKEFTDAGVFHGSYGARIHGRLSDLVSTLANDMDSRQAVLTIFDARSDLGAEKRDIPCTLSVQFLVRDDRLDARVTMRSNDLWLGTPYDFQQFAILQASVAQALDLKPGRYVHSAGSLHFYERDLEKALKVEDAEPGRPMNFPLWKIPESDEALERLEAISKRARDIALHRVDPSTEFEEWATDLLWPPTVWYPGAYGR